MIIIRIFLLNDVKNQIRFHAKKHIFCFVMVTRFRLPLCGNLINV